MKTKELKIAHIVMDINNLPFQIDLDRLNLVKDRLQNNEEINVEDRFYYDGIISDIITIADTPGKTTVAAFLLLQIPFINPDIIKHYIECVYRDEDAISAYFSLLLSRELETDEFNEKLISILIEKGDMPLWIESVRNIPNMPIEAIIKKISMLDSEANSVWNKEIGAQAKEMYDNFLDSLNNPIERAPYTPTKQDINDEENVSRLKRIKQGLGSKVKAVGRSKKP